MAKTTFVNGTIVTTPFLNSIYGADANGGHKHDGTNDDGHCPKIHPVNEVQGVSEGYFDLIFPDTQVTGDINQRNAGCRYRKYMPTTVGFPEIVQLFLPDFSRPAAGTNNDLYAGYAALPAAIRPPNSQVSACAHCLVYADSVLVSGAVVIQSDGDIFFAAQWLHVDKTGGLYKHRVQLGGFAKDLADDKGFPPQVITYPIYR